MKTLALVALLAPLLAPSAAQALNPQPLPPSPARIGSFVNPGVKFLNPQPLPPSPARMGSGLVNPNIKALNPQPLPPRWQPMQPRFGR
jgi:hypothetical protein